jgi:hypothetical protein
MTERAVTHGERRFWALAERLLQQPGVTRSTIMGFPCLRLGGEFFASCNLRPGQLVIKLDARRAAELIDSVRAEPFAPNGRRFREWVSSPASRHPSWRTLLDEALHNAATRQPTPTNTPVDNQPADVRNSVRRTMVSAGYARSTRAGWAGAIRQWPAPSPRRRANRAGESNRSIRAQSIEPSRPTSAAP